MNELLSAIADLCNERGIDEDVIINALEVALVAAYKKNYYKGKNDNPNVNVFVDRETGAIKVYAKKVVVEEVFDPREEISLEDARAIRPGLDLDDVVNIEVTPKDFGRVSAMTAKQVVTQKIREAERGIIYGGRSDRSIGLVSGKIILVDADKVYVDVEQYNQAEAYLPKKEQPEGEVYTPGETMRFYVSDVRTDNKSTQLILSRTHPDLVKKLFEKEVPEIENGVVVIKGIAREGGSRTKIAVYSNDPESGKKAMKMIENIAREIEVGGIYDGVVTRIMPFGAFVDIGGGKEGLLHISKISSKRIDKVEDVLSEGDEITVKVIDIDNQDRINLSMKDLEVGHHEEKNENKESDNNPDNVEE